MSLSYLYFTDRNPGVSPIVFPLFGTSPLVDGLSDTDNPVYNFDQSFVENFQALSPAQLAQAVPYISLCSLDINGKVLTDFNVTFFQKAVDMNKISGQTRYADRPQLSLQSLNVAETLAAGGGLISWKNITMEFKLHKPDFVTNDALITLLFSGLPMRVVYGWSSVPNTGDFLSVKNVLLDRRC